MYKEYFLMRSEPFAPFPSPYLFFKSKGHERAWKELVYCLKRKEPVVMTTGEYGSGKTSLCLKLIQFMEKRRVSPMVYIPSPGYSFNMLLEKIAKSIGLPVDGMEVDNWQRFIFEYFENEPPESQKYVYIILDDVQEFDSKFISQLTKLITFNNYGYFPLRLMMFGHVDFLRRLDRGNFVSFRQRIRAITLYPLSKEEVTEYIYFRLISSGATGSPVFDDAAISLITSASKGLPRLINKICDASLQLAYKRLVNIVDLSIVRSALRETVLRDEPVIDAPVLIPQAPPNSVTPVSEPPVRRVREVPIEPAPQVERKAVRQKDADLFAEKQPEKNGKISKKIDLKKRPLIDGKTLVILFLIAVILLMGLFFLSGGRWPGNGQEKTGNQQVSMIMHAVPDMRTHLVQGSIPAGSVKVIKSINQDEIKGVLPMLDAMNSFNEGGGNRESGDGPVIMKTIAATTDYGNNG